MRIALGYPNREAELEILDTNGSREAVDKLAHVVSAADVRAMVDAVKTVHLAGALKHYLVDLAEASRRHSGLLLGLSPRATLQLARATRAAAAARGRDYATPDDVKMVAEPVLAHRLSIRPDAAGRGLTHEIAVAEVLASVKVPTGR
jgi:MoxR-like ATPase